MSANNKPNEPEKIEEIILVEEIDIEIFAREDKKPPKAKRYRIRVDDKYYVVHQHTITGREILVLAGKTPPEKFILTEKIRKGGVRTITLDEIVELARHGLERFNTLPREVQEG